ncbi:hypothetical protein Lepto7376_3168 [[Leptolyngbya] sp. PCC 7376]|uniref:DUF5340 domain-containing protein n=1 Tax=[Leptolyngbya] sp. PCC 7376 TaxID=111781 RepID=UPI00029ED96E|nr:DUF5340 domain-containing protein [[Leptolyngbya] sp. PCC 7376]AFY39397.1 hypothetical protein Lepto7376_3168 [[Leptolyngbya] sp. PCC 7376]
MKSIPLPSHVHYETILQLLERKTQREAYQNKMTQEQVQSLILTLRKAFSQQKQLERTCDQLRIPYEYHWSLSAQDPSQSKDVNEE